MKNIIMYESFIYSDELYTKMILIFLNRKVYIEPLKSTLLQNNDL